MTDLQRKMVDKLGLIPDDLGGRARNTGAIYCTEDKHMKAR